MRIEITEFSNAYSRATIDLVVGIQRDEFGFAVSEGQQPDLLDVAGHYRRGSGNFWIALADGRLVGTVGLLDVAPRLLELLLDWARSHRFEAIYLGTTSRYHAAHRFYEKHGFTRLPAEDLPEGFPRFDIEDRFYSRSLAAEPEA